jgi:4'-phosphopantetheinyl transferase
VNGRPTLVREGANFRWRPSLSGADALEPTEVEICCVDLADPELNAPHELSAEERARAARQVSVVLNRRYTAARVALRRLLATRLGILRAADVALENAPMGKPRLIPDSVGPDLHFNLSRSADVALVALARGIAVGIDIEQSHSFFGDAGLMDRTLTREERRVVEALAPPQRLQAMGKCWVRKEAVLKAIGIGLAHPLTGFSVQGGEIVDAGSVAVQAADGLPREVFWCQLPLPAEIGFAAVACHA